MTVRKKRLIIIIVWLTSLILFYFVIRAAVFRICERNSILEFLDSIESIPDVVPAFMENEDFTKKEIRSNHEAVVNGLALALEDFEDIKSAEAFLKEYKKVGEVEAIAVFDENGNLVYNDGFNEDETDSEGVYSAKSGRYLVKTKDSYTDMEKDLEFLNGWSRKLSNVIIGESGYLMALDPKDDRILSCYYGTGGTVEDLGMKYGGKPLDYESLKKLLDVPERVYRIDIDGEIQYVAKTGYDDLYLLALFPEKEILYDVRNIVINLMIILALFTGLVMSFLLFTLTDAMKEGDPSKYRRPSGKLLMGMIVSLFLVLFLSTWLGLLDLFMDRYRDCETKTGYISSKLEAGEIYEDIRKGYSDGEYLDKCLMVRSIIGATDRPMQKKDLDRISKSLGISHISVYDETGREKLTNSPFVGERITQESFFYPLLTGRDSMIKEPDEDDASDSCIQYIGACLRNDDGTPEGFVLIGMDLAELRGIQKDIGFENIIRQGNMNEGTFLALIDKEAASLKNAALILNDEERKAEEQYESFSVEGRNPGQNYDGFTYYLFGEDDINLREDYSGMSVEDAGLKEEVLTPDYSGIQTMGGRKYYARSQKVGDDICLVMREKLRMGYDEFLQVILTTAFAMLSMLLMLIIFTRRGNVLEEARYAAEQANAKDNMDGEKFAIDDFVAMFSSLLDAGKPYFEVRWPEDSVAWTDKDASGKLWSIIRGILLAMVVLMIGQQWFFISINDNSIWYYVLSPRWDGGFNVITLTRAGIAVIAIIAVSCIIHKILFYVARASGPHVETICHLLNSFIKYASFVTGIFICISIFRVNTSMAFSISTGVVSVIISIACQSILADILAGIFMVFEGTVTAGEFVYFNDRYGAILSIGIRTTQILWFSEVMVVRNSELKNYVNLPANERNRMTVSIYIDFNEPLARVESIIYREMKGMHERFIRLTGDEDLLGPEYRGIQKFTDNGVALQFAIYTKGLYYGWITRELNRELKMMFERNDIRIAMPQIVVNEPAEHEPAPAKDNYPGQVPGVLDQQAGWDPKIH